MFCDKNSATWPTVAPGMLDPADALLIVAKDNRPENERDKPVRCNGNPPLKFNEDGTPKPFTTSPKSGIPITEVDFLPGVYACHSGTHKVPTAKKELIDALTIAGKLAQERGVYLWVQTGFRSTQEQIAQACEKIKEGKGHAVGGEVAFPGGSNHGAGYAVDVTLWDAKPGFQVAKVGPSCATQWNASKEHSKLLDDIMTQAGFMRYAAEIWHYELGGPTECRCKFPDCPFPNGKEFCRICS